VGAASRWGSTSFLKRIAEVGAGVAKSWGKICVVWAETLLGKGIQMH